MYLRRKARMALISFTFSWSILSIFLYTHCRRQRSTITSHFSQVYLQIKLSTTPNKSGIYHPICPHIFKDSNRYAIQEHEPKIPAPPNGAPTETEALPPNDYPHLIFTYRAAGSVDRQVAFACSASCVASRFAVAAPHWSSEACPPKCGMQKPSVYSHAQDWRCIAPENLT